MSDTLAMLVFAIVIVVLVVGLELRDLARAIRKEPKE